MQAEPSSAVAWLQPALTVKGQARARAAARMNSQVIPGSGSTFMLGTSPQTKRKTGTPYFQASHSNAAIATVRTSPSVNLYQTSTLYSSINLCMASKLI
jgi:hypothetical protein